MKVAIEKVKYHPRNNEFFPRMEGNKWEEFKQDIVDHGILTPVLLTENYVAVAGNERVRAAKETGIKEIECTIKDYHGDEDAVLLDLLRDNLMRRGGNGCSPMQLSKIAAEWGRLRKESKEKGTSEVPSTCDAMRVSKGQLDAYRKLTKLTPDWQELVSNGFNYQFAARMIASMQPDEQDALYAMLPDRKTVNTTDVRNLLEEIERQKLVITDQAECIKKYEEDEDATSDRMEEIYVQLQDANEKLTVMQSANSTSAASIVEQAHKDRDAALQAAKQAEANEQKIKRSTEWLLKTRNEAQDSLAQHRDAAAKVASICGVVLGVVGELKSVESVFDLLSNEQKTSVIDSVDDAINALNNLRKAIHL